MNAWSCLSIFYLLMKFVNEKQKKFMETESSRKEIAGFQLKYKILKE